MNTTHRPKEPPRRPTAEDIRGCLSDGIADFRAAPGIDLFFAGIFVASGAVMTFITWQTGQTFWLILAVLGFPLVGALASIGFYDVSRVRNAGTPPDFRTVAALVWSHRKGQMPWLATIIVILFLFWFFLGHMIFALFLGLSPMTNVSTSLDVFATPEGIMMILFGSAVGAVFASVVYAMSVLGMPRLVDRDEDFASAILFSLGAVRRDPSVYLGWGVFISVVTFLSILPAFLGLLLTLPILGHASWHLFQRVTNSAASV